MILPRPYFLALLSLALIATGFVHAREFPQERGVLNYPHEISSDGEVKVALFDVDGTVRIIKSGGPVATSKADIEILPFTVDRIKKLIEQNYLIGLFTNQGGIPKNASLEQIEQGMQYTLELFAEPRCIILILLGGLRGKTLSLTPAWPHGLSAV